MSLFVFFCRLVGCLVHECRGANECAVGRLARSSRHRLLAVMAERLCLRTEARFVWHRRCHRTWHTFAQRTRCDEGKGASHERLSFFFFVTAVRALRTRTSPIPDLETLTCSFLRLVYPSPALRSALTAVWLLPAVSRRAATLRYAGVCGARGIVQRRRHVRVPRRPHHRLHAHQAAGGVTKDLDCCGEKEGDGET